MKKIQNKVITLMTVLGLVVSSVPMGMESNSITATAATNYGYIEYTAGGASTDTASAHDYISWNRWASPVDSYLEETDNGFCRVEAVSDAVIVEEYSEDYKLLDKRTVEKELPLFGGYFCGSTYRFFVFAQQNPEEDDDAEVFRVVKYDKSWNRIDAASISGINTTVPFVAGSLRMTEGEGKLYIHTCHEMYTSTDGYNHQANMTFVLDQTDLSVTQSWSGIMNIQYGYVSHSFNQFVKTDGTYLYRVDHGDAYPRSVVLTKASTDNIISCKSEHVLPICGEIGANDTGVSVGGFEIAGDQLVVVGNSVLQDAETYSDSGQRNIFVTSTDVDLEETGITWLTEHSADSGIIVGNPHLVKVSDDELYVLWEEQNAEKLITVKVAQINALGSLQGTVHEIYARLSGCAPVYTSGGEIVWYATKNTSPIFYHIATDSLEDYEFTGIINMNDCLITLSQDEIDYVGVQEYRPDVTVTYGSYTLCEGIDYDLSYSNNIIPGTASVIVTGKSLFEGSVTKEFQIVRKYGDGDYTGGNTSGGGTGGNTGGSTSGGAAGSGSSAGTSGSGAGTNTSNNQPAGSTVKKPGKVSGIKVRSTKKKRVTVSWKKKNKVSGYQIQYALNKKFTKGKKTKNVGQKKSSVTLKGLKRGKTYYVRVRAYNKVSGQKVYSKWSKVKKRKVK